MKPRPSSRNLRPDRDKPPGWLAWLCCFGFPLWLALVAAVGAACGWW